MVTSAGQFQPPVEHDCFDNIPPGVQVWIALLATILGVVILMHTLARLTPLGNYDLKAVRLASASSSPPQEYIIDPGMHCRD